MFQIDRLEEEVVKLDQKEVAIEFNRIKEILNQNALVQDKVSLIFLLQLHAVRNHLPLSLGTRLGLTF